MFKRLHCCVFLIGVLLVLLALARILIPTTDEHAHNTLRVAQAVTRLEGGCLSCHSAVAETPASSIYAVHTLSVSASPTVSPEADAQLLDLGQRILALPDHIDDQAAVDAFLHAYDTTTRSVSAVRTGMITGLEALVRDLENQASPYQMKPHDSRLFLSDTAALNTAPASSGGPVALHQRLTLNDTVAYRETSLDDAHDEIKPLERAFATHRRGPPAGADLDSVWSGRLLS